MEGKTNWRVGERERERKDNDDVTSAGQNRATGLDGSETDWAERVVVGEERRRNG